MEEGIRGAWVGPRARPKPGGRTAAAAAGKRGAAAARGRSATYVYRLTQRRPRPTSRRSQSRPRRRRTVYPRKRPHCGNTGRTMSRGRRVSWITMAASRPRRRAARTCLPSINSDAIYRAARRSSKSPVGVYFSRPRGCAYFFEGEVGYHLVLGRVVHVWMAAMPRAIVRVFAPWVHWLVLPRSAALCCWMTTTAQATLAPMLAHWMQSVA